jgi:hypothetical protein
MDVDGLDGGRLQLVGIFRGAFVRGVPRRVILWDVTVKIGLMALAMRRAKSGMVSASKTGLYRSSNGNRDR